MKRKNADKNRGFSLIELIIAIAILVILTGLLAPQFLKYIEKARKAKCLHNQDVILTEYQVRLIEAEEIDTDEDAKQLMEEVITEIKAECPSGGKYEVKIVEDGKRKGIDTNSGWLELACTVHGGDGKGVSSDLMIVKADKVYNSMRSFVDVDVNKIIDVLKKADPNISYFSNDNFRKYLHDVVYQGEWPKFDMSTLPSNSFAAQLYIQTYTTGNKNNWTQVSDDNIVVFANSNSTAKGNWNANLIYHPTEKQWYMASKTGDHTVFNKNWSDMEQEIKDGLWVKIP